MFSLRAPQRLGSGLGLIGILISLITAIGAHHLAGGGWPARDSALGLLALNTVLALLARRAPWRISAFVTTMLGAQFLDHAVMTIAHPAGVGAMCGHAQTHCTLPAPMAMNTSAMVIAHTAATGLAVWMAYLSMRILSVLSDFFARLFAPAAVALPSLSALRVTEFVTQTVRRLHYVLHAPRRGPPTVQAFCA